MSIRPWIAAIVLIALIGGASAYIDPGTGGMIVGGMGSMLWALLATLFAAAAGLVVRFFSPIRRGFQALWKKVRGR
jgi:hypothetical protein